MIKAFYDQMRARLRYPRLSDDDLRLLIDLAYRLYLDRPPDPEGERAYLRQLQNGLSIAEFIKELAASEEAQQVKRLVVEQVSTDRTLCEKLDGEWAHKQLLICRPSGGFNDMLCQIGKCLRYAAAHDRVLIVDTAFEARVWAAGSFGDVLSYYFDSLLPALHLAETTRLPDLEHLTVYPPFLRGRLDTYIGEWDSQAKCLIERDSRLPISFDFNKSYRERLLAHHDAGGGLASLAALRAFRLKPQIRDRLVGRLASIGRPYVAVHIRHTDYKTDYTAAIRAIPTNSDMPLFVATDNTEVIACFREVFGPRVVSFTTNLGTEQTPLHKKRLALEAARKRNTDTILDLLTLALARERYLFPVVVDSQSDQVQPKTPLYSGFSMLAESLAREPQLLSTILSGLDDIAPLVL